ncbi:MAG TPA: hypothetical protein VF622_06685 [Segetibacter sp.]
MVFIFSGCDVFYGSYYIYGFQKHFGKGKVKFSTKRFPSNLKQRTFAAIIHLNNKEKKIIIDSDDSDAIDKDALQWCDAYYKVNLNFNTNHPKLVSIGPSFGIKIWSSPEMLFCAAKNYLSYKKRLTNWKQFFICYYKQNERLPLSEYLNDEKPGRYVFFTSTLWKKEPVSNNLRRNFIKACKEITEIKFEGGFTPRKRKEIQGYEDDTVDRLYPLKEYLNKIKKSVVVFNTPVVLNCHGWKLAEFMAMKKAIISTKISNQLPEPLEDGKNIVSTTGEIADIKKAILSVIENPEYHESLQNNAFEYYNKYLSPLAVITKIITDKYPHQNMSVHE